MKQKQELEEKGHRKKLIEKRITWILH